MYLHDRNCRREVLSWKFEEGAEVLRANPAVDKFRGSERLRVENRLRVNNKAPLSIILNALSRTCRQQEGIY